MTPVSDFLSDFIKFLSSLKILFKVENEYRIVFPEHKVVIIPIPLIFFLSEERFKGYTSDFADRERRAFSDHQVIFLYEDRWLSSREIIKARIKAHLGFEKVIFARNCECRVISADVERRFLDNFHSYGYAKSKYRYGLYFKSSLVAVSTFSASRPMNRLSGVLESYEWVRYASLPDFRIVGGMGKFLRYFTEDQNPQEIMSYADKEWSIGETYLKLGFYSAGETPPIKFYVDKRNMVRISAKKVVSDKQYLDFEDKDLNENYVIIYNMGSNKYLLTL